ncbi:CobW family GTP-binding protein [Desulfosporosinus hippei]|uniref:GTPase, G3E family n=1 Tax=Desulfosporosinus hippei DSM 8344 TaxID=1121419 RepID=A0A1G8JI58_9FIRM|nr:CobW family GTP-binding protein [Desulfosporosinus hippei]SDI30969.1 GTPase, G3E family [Desulfosporosinus hippei DSM 8344]
MVKFDIVSGFLGAGKTTLVKKILHSLDTCEKMVLIENDFGEINVDRELLEIEGFEVYELSNGCVCCKLKGDFLLTLKNLLSQKIDRIIFEPSGIFILEEIFDVFKDSEISGKCFINSLTTVVDVQNFSKNIQGYSEFFKNQIRHASSLVLSKVQFVNDYDLIHVENSLKSLNETAHLVTKDWAQLSTTDIKELINGSYNCVSNRPKQYLSHNFDSLGLKTSKNLSLDQLKNILEKCKKGHFGALIRGKGIINSGSQYLEFNYVAGEYSIMEGSEVAEGMVSFIGKGIAKEALASAFV